MVARASQQRALMSKDIAQGAWVKSLGVVQKREHSRHGQAVEPETRLEEGDVVLDHVRGQRVAEVFGCGRRLLEVLRRRLVVTERDVDHAVRVQRGSTLGCRLSGVMAALDELLSGAHVSPVEGRVSAQGLRPRGLFRSRPREELIGPGGRRRDGVPAAHVQGRRQQAEERVEPLGVRGGVVEGAVAGLDAGGAVAGPELGPLGDRQHLVQAIAIAFAPQRLGRQTQRRERGRKSTLARVEDAGDDKRPRSARFDG